MSLADRLADRFKGSAPPSLAITAKRCLRNRMQGNSCRLCQESCPAQAISLGPAGPQLDISRCLGCLACTTVCPSEAIIGLDRRLSAIGGGNEGPPPSSLCCEKSIRSGEETVLPCLGCLSVEQLAALVARNPTGIRLNLTKCTDCRASHVPALLAERIQRIEDKTGLVGLIHLILDAAEERELAESSSRRAFFRAFSQLSFHAAAETASAIKSEITAPKNAGERHQPARLAFLHQALTGTQDQTTRLALLRLFHRIEVADTCNFCGACAGICPSGALKNRREETSRQLQFDWSRCSGCGLCVDFCRRKALTLSQGRGEDSLATEREVLLEMQV